MEQPPPQPPFDFTAGRLCLDFSNTVATHPPTPDAVQDPPLLAYPDLLEWVRQAGLLDDHSRLRLAALARDWPVAARAVFDRAVVLREGIYRLCLACLEPGSAPAPRDTALLEGLLPEAVAHSRLRSAARVYEWVWEGMDANLEAPLWPIAISAVRLLASADAARVQRCASDRCDWLFIDTSRNHSRRWCSMSGCGNRAKARRHYAKRSAGQA